MQKGASVLILLIAGLVIFGLVSIFAFAFFKKTVPPLPLQPSVSEPVAYSNQQLGLEFTFSDKNFSIKEDSEEEFNKRGNGDFRKNFKRYIQYEPGKFLGAVVVLDKTGSFDVNPLTLWVFDNPNDLSIDDWYKNYWYYPFVWGDFTYTGKTILAPKDEATVSGKVGKSGVIDYQPGKPKFVYVLFDKKMYLFRVIGDIGDKILSSFKLLKAEIKSSGGCKAGGCSGQLCVERDDSGISTCEWREEYACYKGAKCERQADEKCGWTKTEELRQCLKEKSTSSKFIL